MLLEKLRAEMEGKENRESLQAVSGIEDAAVLDSLLEQNITPETLAAVSLIPLVSVAWSDGVMEDSEKTAILKAAEGTGVASGTSTYSMLESWLTTQPEAGLLESWEGYIGAVVGSLDSAAGSQLKTSLLSRAKAVAEAAGGFLGLGNKVSASEKAVLDRLEKAFG